MVTQRYRHLALKWQIVWIVSALISLLFFIMIVVVDRQSQQAMRAQTENQLKTQIQNIATGMEVAYTTNMNMVDRFWGVLKNNYQCQFHAVPDQKILVGHYQTPAIYCDG